MIFENEKVDNIIKNIDELCEIIKKENINQVSIHPFKTYYAAVSACIKSNIQYHLYFHGVDLFNIIDIDDCYLMLGKENKLFLYDIAFEYATKYVYVSEEVKEFYEKKYNFEETKGFIQVNSFDMELIDSTNKTSSINNINKFVIVSRIDEAKINSIISGVNVFKLYCDKSTNKNDLSLDIIGDGSKIEDLKNYIKTECENYNINILGYRVDVINDLKEYDAVLGMGRCVLEAMLCKKIPILISYDGKGVILNNENIYDAKKTNYSGRNIEKKETEELVNDILKLEKSQIINIIEYNFEFIIKNHNIANNIVHIYKNHEIDNTLALKKIDNFFEIKKLFEENEGILNYLYDRNKMLTNNVSEFEAEIKKLNNVNQELTKTNECIKEEKVQLQNRLDSITNKSLYKLYVKFKKIFK